MMSVEVPTKESFEKLVAVVDQLAGEIQIPEELKPAIKAVLEWLASKMDGTITWS